MNKDTIEPRKDSYGNTMYRDDWDELDEILAYSRHRRKGQIKDAILAWHNKKVKEARIDELNRTPRINYGNDFAIHINAYIDNRIAELKGER